MIYLKEIMQCNDCQYYYIPQLYSSRKIVPIMVKIDIKS